MFCLVVWDVLGRFGGRLLGHVWEFVEAFGEVISMAVGTVVEEKSSARTKHVSLTEKLLETLFGS